jgi:hypothetical protein
MIIGLTGRKGSGKSTVAQLMKDTYDYEIMGFGDTIKKMLAAMGVPLENLMNPQKKEEEVPGFGKSARFMMQTLGTEWARDIISDSVWLTVMDKRLEGTQATLGSKIVIDDVRFSNEAEFIRKKGGKVVHIRRRFDPHEEDHVSEKGLHPDEIDATIDNVSCYTTDLLCGLKQYMEDSNNGLIHLTQP